MPSKKSSGDAEMDELHAQLSALSAGMGAAPEDKVSQADVDKVIAEALAGIKKDAASKSSKRASTAAAAGATGASASEQGASEESGPDFAEGRDALQAALQAVRSAVALDANGSIGAAAIQYDRALEKFGNALQCGVPQGEQAQEKLLTNMAGYMDRLQAILLAMDPQPEPLELTASAILVPYTSINASRVDTLKAMARAGFKCASRAVALRKQGKLAEEDGDAWTAFILYSEAIDCFMAYLKTDASGSGAKTVEKAVLELLDAAEALKQEMSS
ncbi:Hypothetical Protein FCC1311_092702 [Hondaea fermentalgiana]|uniref:MIT domain-containing protein n=1 Tax=Hondaea fermentalgiana TaxID=2315210 RepID=A0A2R5GQ93_9STRA|nr:Hypothetical Protein FCC1311_092702 [Hondaea fermentalgiana]|eukprot:GBG33046.1 Hypothetical Protein FCC1311_092702 [Hondaea fermentalgiana]